MGTGVSPSVTTCALIAGFSLLAPLPRAKADATPSATPAPGRDDGAHAQADGDDVWQTRPNAIAVHAGAGTPVGYLGLAYRRTLVGRLSASLGFGVGSGRDDSGSLQLAADADVRVVQSVHYALSVAVGYSTGGFRSYQPLSGLLPSHGSGEETFVYSPRMHWLNALVVGELRTAAGFVFRTYLGLGLMLNPDSRRCIGADSGRPCAGFNDDDFGDPSIPIMGLAVGTAL